MNGCQKNNGWFCCWIFEKWRNRQITDVGFLDVLVSDQAARLNECYRAHLLYGVSVDRKAPCGGTLKGEALNGA